MGTAVGVDWAKGVWLSFSLDDGDQIPVAESFDTLDELWTTLDSRSDIRRLCIDVPLGLPTGPDERAVDKECRKHLSRTSSVFRVPVREALDTDTPAEANEASRAVTGEGGNKPIGVQPPAYAIRKQILCANEFVDGLAENTRQHTVYEVHPELCFKAFAGDPPAYSKKSAQGIAERLDALAAIHVDSAAVFHRATQSVREQIGQDHAIKIDDVVDTLAALYTAAAPDKEFHLLSVDGNEMPSHRMAYRADEPLGS